MNETENTEDDMTLSQEILVLDFGDEKQSQFLKNNEALFSEFGKGILWQSHLHGMQIFFSWI